MTAIGGGLWVSWTYLDHQKEQRVHQARQLQTDNLTRRLVAQKPFIDEQLARYIETAKVVGRLAATNNFKEKQWNEDILRFEQLYWTELSMVEDEQVKHGMQTFGKKLRYIDEKVYPLSKEEQSELQNLSYSLALALKKSIEQSWKVDLTGEGTAE